MEVIQDGTGKGYSMKVDSEGRAHVDSVSTLREENQSQRGFAYNINTGLITLTNASVKNAVLYIKNNEDYNLIITNLVYQTGASTGGSGNIYVDVVRNPTLGTIVSTATPVDININKNFGSSRSLNVTAFKGTTSATITDGTDAYRSILGTVTQRIAVTGGSLSLPKGASIGINLTTPAGNTSMAVMFAIGCYLEDETEQF